MTVRYKWNFPKFCYDCSPPHDPKWKNRELGPFMRHCSRMPRWHWLPSKEHGGMNNNNHNHNKYQTSNRRRPPCRRRRKQQQQQYKHPHGASVGDGDNPHKDLVLHGSRAVVAATKQRKVFGSDPSNGRRTTDDLTVPMRWAEPPIHLERTHTHTQFLTVHHLEKLSLSREPTLSPL